MANVHRLLENVGKELRASRAGVGMYYAGMGAREQGQVVEKNMERTEIRLASIALRLKQIQYAADIGDLTEIKRLLAEEIPVNVLQAPQTQPA